MLFSLRTSALFTVRRMSLHTRAKTPSILLCADFDETITQRDTISLLFQLSSSSAATQNQLVTQYVDEFNTFLNHYETKWQQQCNSTRFDIVGLREFLEGYAATDLRSLQRVIECRALQGIRHQDLVDAAKAVEIRPSCVETLAILGEWKIVSANWSEELVRCVLQEAEMVGEVIANEMKVDEQGVTTGEIQVTVQSPMDKARRIGEVRGNSEIVVYVGDSANDLLAMLEADVGIWFVSETTTSSAKLLQQLVEQYGIEVRSLKSYASLDCVVKRKDDSIDRPVLFSMTDWTQLKAMIRVRLREH